MIHVYQTEDSHHRVEIEGGGLELAAEIALILQRFTELLIEDGFPDSTVKTIIESILHAAFSDERRSK